MTWLLQDVRYAIRQLIKAPSFTAVALLVLGVGIGVNSTFFNVVNAILLRPAGYARPEELVDVYTTSMGARYGTTSYQDYLDLRNGTSVFTGIALYRFGSLGLARHEETRTPSWVAPSTPRGTM
jgi:hypothetical protein